MTSFRLAPIWKVSGLLRDYGAVIHRIGQRPDERIIDLIESATTDTRFRPKTWSCPDDSSGTR
jgi:hypothetical protein